MLVDGVEKNVARRRYCVQCVKIGCVKESLEKGKVRRRKPESKEKQAARQNKRRVKLKLKCVNHLGGKCVICGYDRYIGALEFHHRIPSLKSFPLDANSLARRPWEHVLIELEKCILVCSRCHREIEGGIITFP